MFGSQQLSVWFSADRWRRPTAHVFPQSSLFFIMFNSHTHTRTHAHESTGRNHSSWHVIQPCIHPSLTVNPTGIKKFQNKKNLVIKFVNRTFLEAGKLATYCIRTAYEVGGVFKRKMNQVLSENMFVFHVAFSLNSFIEKESVISGLVLLPSTETDITSTIRCFDRMFRIVSRLFYLFYWYLFSVEFKSKWSMFIFYKIQLWARSVQLWWLRQVQSVKQEVEHCLSK